MTLQFLSRILSTILFLQTASFSLRIPIDQKNYLEGRLGNHLCLKTVYLQSLYSQQIVKFTRRLSELQKLKA